MVDERKLRNSLFYDLFPNKMLLGFDNLLKDYLPSKTGKIIDIGCGQSPYIIDLLGTDYDLFAVDTDIDELNYLKKRIEDEGFSSERVHFSQNEFPSADFGQILFSGVIISNLLHFFPLKKAIKWISELKKYTIPGSVYLITVHSYRHRNNYKENINRFAHFKHYYRKTDFEKLFPSSEFEYLYVAEKEAKYNTICSSFIKEWIKQLYIKQRGINDSKLIEKAQYEYLNKNGFANNFTVVVKQR
jgi:SAM-dependent methyltransferase